MRGSRDLPGACGLGRSNVGAATARGVQGFPGRARAETAPLLEAQSRGAPGSERARR